MALPDSGFWQRLHGNKYFSYQLYILIYQTPLLLHCDKNMVMPKGLSRRLRRAMKTYPIAGDK